MMGLPDGQKGFKIGLAVWAQYRRVTRRTDGRMDRQTRHDSKDRAMQSVARVKKNCRRPTNQNTTCGRVLDGWVWLTSVTLAVIGRPSKMLAYNSARCRTDVADVFMMSATMSATNLM